MPKQKAGLARCWLNSPCNSSTVLLNSSRTCNIPHHGVAPDRNQVAIVGMELPAFQLSMNVFFRFHRNAPGSLELVWRDLSGRIARPRLPARFLAATKAPKIRNPASSAGHSHLFFQWLRAKLDKILASARKVPHSRIWLLPCRPDRESPDRLGDLAIVRTICNYTETS